MTNPTAGARACYPAVLTAALCLIFVPTVSNAAPEESPKSTAAAEKPTEPQQPSSEFVVREYGARSSQYELVSREELSRLRAEVENNKKSAWVVVAPWLALLVIGVAWVVAWSLRSQQELEFKKQELKLRELELGFKKLELELKKAELEAKKQSLDLALKEHWRAGHGSNDSASPPKAAVRKLEAIWRAIHRWFDTGQDPKSQHPKTSTSGESQS